MLIRRVLMEKFFRFFAVLKHGESLLHSATWKNVQLATTAAAVVIAFGLSFTNGYGLTPEQVIDVAKAIAIIGGALNGYLTVATTDKLGATVSTVNELPNLGQPEAELPVDEVQASNSLDGGSDLLGGR